MYAYVICITHKLHSKYCRAGVNFMFYLRNIIFINTTAARAIRLSTTIIVNVTIIIRNGARRQYLSGKLFLSRK